MHPIAAHLNQLLLLLLFLLLLLPVLLLLLLLLLMLHVLLSHKELLLIPRAHQCLRRMLFAVSRVCWTGWKIIHCFH
jgi:hypothetical protein